MLKLGVEAGLARLARHDAPFLQLFSHGTLEIELYKPDQVDRQQPHSRDELYVVASGTGEFLCGDEQEPVVPGDVLFVPAHKEHRFVSFSEDFSTWVFFYGPEGGESDLR
jgi:mannose-6-phosphate isomerase-like protein (cupin superfamily)